MKFTLSWLKDHLDTAASAEAVAEALTRGGLEVEGIEDKAKALAPFVVGHVVECAKHPNADKLSLCRVDGGAGEIRVVCGAPNVRAGNPCEQGLSTLALREHRRVYERLEVNR